MSPQLPERVLIANRGEIAIRVTRTCHAAGVEVVAVYSPHDAASSHILVADRAVPIQSYVDIDELVGVASQHRCDAIHPGYGFLSENAEFARAVTAAGLIWIGPPVEAIEVMGNKASARSMMIAADVPVVPGTEPGSADTLAEAAESLQYPVFLKAVSGGGGKGMSIVHDREELVRVFRQSTEEAKRSFGDGAMYLEKVVEKPRHIEIQIFADEHGSTVALGERECSIQRRHQKIVEETPSTAVDPELRKRMSTAAVAAARAVGYVGAGTVEFLLDPVGGFYFLEMNTRLQVEHPVTEWVTGLDLVRLQLEVACGTPLPREAMEPRFLGHALECRIYAEDPAAGNLPQSGRLLLVREPNGPGVRVDSALAEGQEVTIHFDPMLAKLSTWARDRAGAIARMQEALRRFVVLGVATNIDHLQDILATPAFQAGDMSTGFLEQHMPDWPGTIDVPELALAATAVAERFGAGRGRANGGDTHATAYDPWDAARGLRIGGRGEVIS